MTFHFKAVKGNWAKIDLRLADNPKKSANPNCNLRPMLRRTLGPEPRDPETVRASRDRILTCNERTLKISLEAAMAAAQSYQEGEKLKAEGKFDEAAEKFAAALQEDESYVLAHHALAVTYNRLGKYDESIRHALRACELEPRDPFSYMSLSVIYQRTFQGTQDPRYIKMAEDAMAQSHALRGQGHH
jgi:tetratricopeptide (TPR) repeat protein